MDYLSESERSRQAAGELLKFLVEILNAAARSGESEYLLARRLNLVLTASRGEGRSIRELLGILSEQYCSGLMSALLREFPELTPGETSICGMMVIGMEPAAICKICRYDNEHSFYNRRAEIRRKLGLGRQVQLERYLLERSEKLGLERRRRIVEMSV